MAATALESSLLKYSAKDYFFNASLCHMCVDSLNAHHALQRYEDQFPAFADTREAKLIKVTLQYALPPLFIMLIVSLLVCELVARNWLRK